MLPALAAVAGQAFSSFFGGPDGPSGPMMSGGGVFAPGGIQVGSKVIGRGSAATTQAQAQPSPPPGVPPAANAAPGSASASGGGAVPAWMSGPVVWIAAGVGVLLLLVLLLPSGRRDRGGRERRR